MNQQDLAHIALAFFVYEIGGQDFWGNVSKITEKVLPELEEESLSMIMRVGFQKFDKQFADRFAEVFMKQHEKYSVVFFANVTNNLQRLEEGLAKKISNVIEVDVESRAKAGRVSDSDYSLLVNAMGKQQIGAQEFWEFTHNHFKRSKRIESMSQAKNMYNMDNRMFLCQLVEGLLTSRFSNKEMTDFLMPYVSEILKLRNLKQKELISYITSFSRAKIADNFVWLQLEK